MQSLRNSRGRIAANPVSRIWAGIRTRGRRTPRSSLCRPRDGKTRSEFVEHDDDDRSNEDLEEQLPLSSKGWRALMETYTRGIKRSVFGEPPRAFPTLPFVRVSLRLTRDTWPRTTSELGFPLCRENTLAWLRIERKNRGGWERGGKEGFEIDLLERVLIVERRN